VVTIRKAGGIAEEGGRNGDAGNMSTLNGGSGRKGSLVPNAGVPVGGLNHGEVVAEDHSVIPSNRITQPGSTLVLVVKRARRDGYDGELRIIEGGEGLNREADGGFLGNDGGRVADHPTKFLPAGVRI
jgi:hypothetical protein